MLELSYYGDDFTGSTDVLEALSGNGIPTVLFTRIPTDAQLAQFSDVRAVGLAGESRSRSPEWMDAHLPAAFEWLKSLEARHCHYKVCSTFDSAPNIGSIGRAAELGMAVFGQTFLNVVIGAPELRRYTLFGTLFASYQDKVYRIDRHPVMSRHPATPMAEADLRRHLSDQTTMQVGGIDPDAALGVSDLEALRNGRAAGDRISIIDVYDDASQARAGALIEDALSETGSYVVGSSGVEYALLEAWRDAGIVDPATDIPVLDRKDVIAIVSGSCSPTTERQIQTALRNGFVGVAVDYKALAHGQGAEDAMEKAFTQADAAIRLGHSPILYTALGAPAEAQPAASNDKVGRALGRLLQNLMDAHPIDRVGVAGGDTSSHALSALDTFALTLRRPLPDTPGSPVCVAHRDGQSTFEIALKGGQVGSDEYFVNLRDGL
ncbi:four-carbon acid sugar kinase family protein [Marimonas arenosa]|uniref:Four-carbon acid sugar kinase family protein n=1 Tax=Marimonas arenosa TaxID=1795305 RepID=A0AAE3WA72_9RHOB|nr:four-carbon acid sugar kinase family protein [Marimonas arenosa]MDQ2088977.1 four-carbon acid sugar kinase family protein [Marimonas arenosa]